MSLTDDIARPENAKAYSEAHIYAACKAFISTFTAPAINPKNIIQGWQNRMSLPPNTNEYAVMSIMFNKQHGTNIEAFDASDPDKTKPGILTVKGLVEVAVQIDYCSDSDDARGRAQRLAIVSRSSIGVQFFNDRGMSILYADDVQNSVFVDESEQYVKRYFTVLHLSVWDGISADFPYFDEAILSKVEDVNVHHPIHRR